MRRSARALTLIELVIGIAVTTLVGLSVAAVSGVLSDSYSQGEAYYRSMQSARIAMMNLQSKVRKAHLITQASGNEMMIWQEPGGDDGKINPSELTLTRYDAYQDKITKYQIVTPTNWNASPRDDDGQMGPIEQALIGTTVADVDNPIELLRVVHSFDPCLACSVHLVTPKDRTRGKFAV